VKSKSARVTLAATVRALEDGSAGKITVFGLFKPGAKIYTKTIPDTSSATLFLIMAHKTVPDSIVYMDGWPGYTVLDVPDFRHFRINHLELFADEQNHINGIENFWEPAKRICANSTVSQWLISGYFQRSASGDLTTVTR
jgi:transposase-like protein